MKNLSAKWGDIKSMKKNFLMETAVIGLFIHKKLK